MSHVYDHDLDHVLRPAEGHVPAAVLSSGHHPRATGAPSTFHLATRPTIFTPDKGGTGSAGTAEQLILDQDVVSADNSGGPIRRPVLRCIDALGSVGSQAGSGGCVVNFGGAYSGRFGRMTLAYCPRKMGRRRERGSAPPTRGSKYISWHCVLQVCFPGRLTARVAPVIVWLVGNTRPPRGLGRSAVRA